MVFVATIYRRQTYKFTPLTNVMISLNGMTRCHLWAFTNTGGGGGWSSRTFGTFKCLNLYLKAERRNEKRRQILEYNISYVQFVHGQDKLFWWFPKARTQTIADKFLIKMPVIHKTITMESEQKDYMSLAFYSFGRLRKKTTVNRLFTLVLVWDRTLTYESINGQCREKKEKNQCI